LVLLRSDRVTVTMSAPAETSGVCHLRRTHLIIRALDNPDNGYRRAAHFLTAQRSDRGACRRWAPVRVGRAEDAWSCAACHRRPELVVVERRQGRLPISGAIFAQVTCHRLPPSSCLHNGGAWPARLGLPADRHEVVHANALHHDKLARAIGRAAHVVRPAALASSPP